jgi:predicted RNA-binding Zn-ribbon protein involved in translation (DUF1610 family)
MTLADSTILTVRLGRAFPAEEWERVEDILAHALHLAGYAGAIHNEATGNTTAIRDLSRKSSAVQEVDWTKHMHTLFCPDCGDTLFCNRCGKDAHGGSAVDEPTDDDTPLAEVLDDHPVEGIDY